MVGSDQVFTARLAAGLDGLVSLERLGLWGYVTRTALRHITPIPDLAVLHINTLRGPGRLEYFAQMQALREISANWGVVAEDLLEILQAPKLQKLMAHYARVTPAVADALGATSLHLDLEGATIDDDIAAILGRSRTIAGLEIADTELTGRGLRHLCGMKQLRMLDVWATRIEAADLECLAELPALTYFSLGIERPGFQAKDIIPHLLRLAPLEQLWLDGFALTEAEIEALKARHTLRWNPPL
ncbi:MAG: hypothetical protein AAF844_14520 [Pseudomonadota bacterium]